MTRKLLTIMALGVFASFPPSCSKTTTQQQTQQQDLSSVITTGTWAVGRFVSDKTDLSGSFSGYLFLYSTNGTVNAEQGGLSIGGTWSGTISSLTFIQNFPGASDPISRLSASWQILGISADTLVVKSNLDTLLMRRIY